MTRFPGNRAGHEIGPLARVKDDYRNLEGVQKAAIFMLVVSNQHSAQLFEKMDDEQIRDLSQAMSSLGSINAIVATAKTLADAGEIVIAGNDEESGLVY